MKKAHSRTIGGVAIVLVLLSIISVPLLMSPKHPTHQQRHQDKENSMQSLLITINTTLSKVVAYQYYTQATLKTLSNQTISSIEERGEVNYLQGYIQALRIVKKSNITQYQAILVNMTGRILIRTYNSTGQLINSTSIKATPQQTATYDPFYYLAYALSKLTVKSISSVGQTILITLVPSDNATNITNGVRILEVLLHVDPRTYLVTQMDYMLISENGSISRITTYFYNYQLTQ